MKAPMGLKVKEALSDLPSARKLTGAIIANINTNNEFTIQGVLANGQPITLKRISLKNK